MSSLPTEGQYLPTDPNFSRRGEYSTNNTPRMYHGNHEDPPPTSWGKVQKKADNLRDYIGEKCCACVYNVPSIALAVGLMCLVGILILMIPLTFILASIVPSHEALTQGQVRIEPIRYGFPWPGYMEDLDSKEELDNLRLLSALALFPPNVSMCVGFGFSCASRPSQVISAGRRCDGKNDCEDGSDENDCKSCQSGFSCPIDGSGGRFRCVPGDQLCDGLAACDDGSDEKTHCRKKNEECPAESRRCNNTELCLPERFICDGNMDCQDGDDEEKCSLCHEGAKMCAPTGRCIGKRQLCDGIPNCPDGSDEEGCNCMTCSGSDRALCGNKRCIERSRVCDGTPDCEDGLDEERCPGTCRDDEEKMPTKVATVVCADQRRYPMVEACSRALKNCSYSCPKCDERLAFTCDDNKYIQRSQVCDGSVDCNEGEDQKGCECDRNKLTFKCKKSEGREKCVSMDRRCDSVHDCIDGSDEKDCETCPPDSFRCEKERKCTPQARCDGRRDCEDGTDEEDCTCRECAGLRSNTYKCEAAARCFLRDAVCAPFSLFPNPNHSSIVSCSDVESSPAGGTSSSVDHSGSSSLTDPRKRKATAPNVQKIKKGRDGDFNNAPAAPSADDRSLFVLYVTEEFIHLVLESLEPIQVPPGGVTIVAIHPAAIRLVFRSVRERNEGLLRINRSSYREIQPRAVLPEEYRRMISESSTPFVRVEDTSAK